MPPLIFGAFARRAGTPLTLNGPKKVGACVSEMLCRSIAVGGAIFGRFAVLNELWRKRMIDERQPSMFFQETNSNKIGYLWLK